MGGVFWVGVDESCTVISPKVPMQGNPAETAYFCDWPEMARWASEDFKAR